MLGQKLRVADSQVLVSAHEVLIVGLPFEVTLVGLLDLDEGLQNHVVEKLRVSTGLVWRTRHLQFDLQSVGICCCLLS